MVLIRIGQSYSKIGLLLSRKRQLQSRTCITGQPEMAVSDAILRNYRLILQKTSNTTTSQVFVMFDAKCSLYPKLLHSVAMNKLLVVPATLSYV